MQSKLKPCPFCGCKAEIRVVKEGEMSIISCATHHCGVSIHSFNNGETDQEVAVRLANAWNRRADNENHQET